MKKMSILIVVAALSIATFGCKKKDATTGGEGSGSGSGSAEVGGSGGSGSGSGSGSTVVAASGGGGAASSADCTVAINHGMELSAPMMSKMPNYAALKDKMRDLGIQRCTEDKWNADAVKCMTEAKSETDAQACYGKLTKEQSDTMNNAAMALMAPPAAGSGSGSAK